MHDPSLISRRAALLAAACALASTSVAGRALAAGQRRRAPVPLPTAAQIRRDYQEMVDFGPRLPGNANHLAFALGHDADKVALHHHRTNAGYVGDR